MKFECHLVANSTLNLLGNYFYAKRRFNYSLQGNKFKVAKK